jgi:hypothetical protein
MSVAPPVPVLSLPATPHSRLLYTVVALLVPSVPPVTARSHMPSHSARASSARKDLFTLPLRLGAFPSPGAALHDNPLPYSAAAPLPAAAAGPASGPAKL